MPLVRQVLLEPRELPALSGLDCWDRRGPRDLLEPRERQALMGLLGPLVLLDRPVLQALQVLQALPEWPERQAPTDLLGPLVLLDPRELPGQQAPSLGSPPPTILSI